MSEVRDRAAKARADFERSSRTTTTATIVTMVLVLGALVLLASALSFALGTSPEREVLRRGTVQIEQCRSDPTQLWTAQVCTGTVSWEPEEHWVKGHLDFPTAPQVSVLSRQALSGTVEVESHRKSWRSGPTGADTLNQDEVLVPAGQFHPSGAGTTVAVVAACVVVPVGLGLLVSWIGTRRARSAYTRALPGNRSN